MSWHSMDDDPAPSKVSTWIGVCPSVGSIWRRRHLTTSFPVVWERRGRPMAGILQAGTPSDALQTTASPAEELSLPLPVVTKHEVILGTAAAIAVAPSLKGEDATFEGADAPRAVGHLRLVEQRRNPQHSQSPMATLKQMPALVVLQRIPVPVLAIAYDGSVLFH